MEELTFAVRVARLGKLEIRCQLENQHLAQGEYGTRQPAETPSCAKADSPRDIPLIGTILMLHGVPSDSPGRHSILIRASALPPDTNARREPARTERRIGNFRSGQVGSEVPIAGTRRARLIGRLIRQARAHEREREVNRLLTGASVHLVGPSPTDALGRERPRRAGRG